MCKNESYMRISCIGVNKDLIWSFCSHFTVINNCYKTLKKCLKCKKKLAKKKL
jgi:hypothetical protein